MAFRIEPVNDGSTYWATLRNNHADAMNHYDSEQSEGNAYIFLLALDERAQYLGGAVLCIKTEEIGLYPDAKYAYLDDIFVDTAYRRQGIGTALLKRVLAEAWAHEAAYAYWVTSWENTEAVALYHALGCAMNPYPISHDSPGLGGAYDVYVQNPTRNMLGS